MALAIGQAKKSDEPLKCGVVIVKNAEILAQAHNSQRADKDASAHAEINAIRLAGKRLDSKNLEGCDVFCTCEPCVMCMAALSYAKVKRIVFGASLDKVSPPKKLISIALDTFLEKAPHKPSILRNFMEEECSRINEQGSRRSALEHLRT